MYYTRRQEHITENSAFFMLGIPRFKSHFCNNYRTLTKYGIFLQHKPYIYVYIHINVYMYICIYIYVKLES